MSSPLTPYIALAEYAVILTCLGVSCYHFLQLLYNYCYVKISTVDVSTSMVIYMVSEVVFDLGAFVHVLFLTVFWRPSDVIYNSYLLYYTGSISTMVLILSPIPVFFLAFDRFLCIWLPVENQLIRKRGVTVVTVVALLLFTGIGIFLHVLPGYPSNSSTNCRSYGCLGPLSAGRVYTICRYVCSIGNVIMGILLARIMKSKNNKNGPSRNSKLVLTTVIMSVCLEFVPHLITFVLNTFFDFNITMFGPFSLLFSSIQSCGCAVIYFKTLKKQQTIRRSTANLSGIKITANARVSQTT